MISFSGMDLDVLVCAGGFTVDTDNDGIPDDCSIGLNPGGGFLIQNFITVADGTGAEVCPDERRLHGCRVLDFPLIVPNWSLIRLDPDDEDSDSDSDSDSD